MEYTTHCFMFFNEWESRHISEKVETTKFPDCKTMSFTISYKKYEPSKELKMIYSGNPHSGMS